MKYFYHFRVSTGSGTFMTDAKTLAEAQEQLDLHFLLEREVIVSLPGSKKSPDRSGAKSSPGVGEAGESMQ